LTPAAAEADRSGLDFGGVRRPRMVIGRNSVSNLLNFGTICAIVQLVAMRSGYTLSLLTLPV
jgi:hypothetical protein